MSLLKATCDGRIDLFGRRHFVGIVPRVVQTLSMIPTGILKQALDANVIMLNYFWSASDISLVDKNAGKYVYTYFKFHYLLFTL